MQDKNCTLVAFISRARTFETQLIWSHLKTIYSAQQPLFMPCTKASSSTRQLPSCLLILLTFVRTFTKIGQRLNTSLFIYLSNIMKDLLRVDINIKSNLVLGRVFGHLVKK